MADIAYCPVCATNDDRYPGENECNNCGTLYAFESTLPTMLSWSQPFTGAILFCPSCCSNLDAEGWGLKKYDCPDCKIEFSVLLDPETVALHSMYG